MDMSVRNLEASNHQTDSRGRKDRHLGSADRVRNLDEVSGCLCAQVGPEVCLLAGDDECVTWSEGPYVQNADAQLVLPQHPRRDLSVDDLGKNACHSVTIGRPASSHARRGR